MHHHYPVNHPHHQNLHQLLICKHQHHPQRLARFHHHYISLTPNRSHLHLHQSLHHQVQWLQWLVSTDKNVAYAKIIITTK